MFSEIEGALLDGRFDAGAHHSREPLHLRGEGAAQRSSTSASSGKARPAAPIPLGGDRVRRSLPDDVKQRVNRVVRRSVEYAFAHREASLPYVRAHAQEMSEEVMYKHIDLYVNHFSVDLGPEGTRAVTTLFERAAALDLIPASSEPLFV